jgi:hypothetical protein
MVKWLREYNAIVNETNKMVNGMQYPNFFTNFNQKSQKGAFIIKGLMARDGCCFNIVLRIFEVTQ